MGSLPWRDPSRPRQQLGQRRARRGAGPAPPLAAPPGGLGGRLASRPPPPGAPNADRDEQPGATTITVIDDRVIRCARPRAARPTGPRDTGTTATTLAEVSGPYPRMSCARMRTRAQRLCAPQKPSPAPPPGPASVGRIESGSAPPAPLRSHLIPPSPARNLAAPRRGVRAAPKPPVAAARPAPSGAAAGSAICGARRRRLPPRPPLPCSPPRPVARHGRLSCSANCSLAACRRRSTKTRSPSAAPPPARPLARRPHRVQMPRRREAAPPPPREAEGMAFGDDPEAVAVVRALAVGPAGRRQARAGRAR